MRKPFVGFNDNESTYLSTRLLYKQENLIIKTPDCVKQFYSLLAFVRDIIRADL